eukprot:388360-Prorocentrum_minimum.AAC.1
MCRHHRLQLKRDSFEARSTTPPHMKGRWEYNRKHHAFDDLMQSVESQCEPQNTTRTETTPLRTT